MDTIEQPKIPRQLHAHHSPQGCFMFYLPRLLPTSESQEAFRMCGNRKRAYWKYDCEQSFEGRRCLSFSPSLQTTCLQAHLHHAHVPHLLCNITLHPKTVSKSLQMDKDQELERNTWCRSMHLSNEPFWWPGWSPVALDWGQAEKVHQF